MSDPGDRDEGRASPPGTGKNGNSLQQRQQLSELLLGIVDREIGRGEPRRPEDWARLRTLAVGHPGAAELVASLEEVLEQAAEEMTAHARAGVDLVRIRQSVVELIRVSLLKKLGLSDQPPEAVAQPRPLADPALPRETDGAARQQNQQLSDLVMAITEREIGRGEPRRPEDWARLHALAAGHPGGSNMVTNLEAMIEQCKQEMANHLGSAGADVSKIRQSVVALVRVSLFKKLGLAEGSKIKES
jgi:hypothetical protein